VSIAIGKQRCKISFLGILATDLFFIFMQPKDHKKYIVYVKLKKGSVDQLKYWENSYSSKTLKF